MKILSKTNKGNVYSTNYKPMFGYRSLLKLLKSKGIDCHDCGKCRNTNSYYITACNEQETLFFEIRLSDHTKFQDNDCEKSYTNFYAENTLECNIVCKDGFAKAKEEIIKLLK